MKRNTIPVEYYLDALAVLPYATKEQINLLLKGSTARLSRTEIVLPRLTERHRIEAIAVGKKLVYALRRNVRGMDLNDPGIYPKLVHGVACSEIIVRFWRAKVEGEIIAERFFYGCGVVPEAGIRYADGKMLVFEFSTKSNFRYTGLMNGKINAYRRNLEKIEEEFQAKSIVVFVLDVPRITVERYVGSLKRNVGSVADGESSAPSEGDGFPSDPFYFVDYETFLKVPIGDQLKAPIYLWMDGREYPLTK
jgi:hypothetical protein